MREAQYDGLQARHRGGLLRALSFFHLKQGIAPRTVHVGGGVDETKEKSPGHGASRAVQERLAALRTDLDAFSELEAEMLMMNGYSIASECVRREDFEVGSAASAPAVQVTPGPYSFFRVQPLMTASPTGGETAANVLRLLDVGQRLVGKAFLVDRKLRTVGIAVFSVLLVGAAVLVVFNWSSQVVQFSLGAMVTAIVAALVGWKAPGVKPWIDAARGKIPFLDPVTIVPGD